MQDDAVTQGSDWSILFVTLAGREPATRSRPPSHVLGDGRGGGHIGEGGFNIQWAACPRQGVNSTALALQ